MSVSISKIFALIATYNSYCEYVVKEFNLNFCAYSILLCSCLLVLVHLSSLLLFSLWFVAICYIVCFVFLFSPSFTNVLLLYSLVNIDAWKILTFACGENSSENWREMWSVGYNTCLIVCCLHELSLMFWC